jgi:hypothetical protein
MDDLKKGAWNNQISRRRVLTYGLAGMAGAVGGFWTTLALQLTQNIARKSGTYYSQVKLGLFR